MDKNIHSEIKFERGSVYFEKQSDDRLCGLHCLNSLLQGPYFDVVSLSEIGMKLDEMERNLYGVGYSQNNNVDDDGNYNLQVLSEALKIYGTELEALKSKEAIKLIDRNLESIEAFIFNSSTHWFAIRKINGVWFNLNSTNSFPGPEIISDFYLSAFLQGSEDIGYTNFLIKNLPNLPLINSGLFDSLQSHQKLVKFSDITKAKESKKEGKKEVKVDPPKDEKKFNAFAGKGIQISDESNISHNKKTEFEDDEMKIAYQLSLEEFIKDLDHNLPIEPLESETNSVNILIKYFDKTFSRRFSLEDKIEDVVNFSKIKIFTFDDIELFETFPRKVYGELGISLKSAGLKGNIILMAKLK